MPFIIGILSRRLGGMVPCLNIHDCKDTHVVSCQTGRQEKESVGANAKVNQCILHGKQKTEEGEEDRRVLVASHNHFHNSKEMKKVIRTSQRNKAIHDSFLSQNHTRQIGMLAQEKGLDDTHLWLLWPKIGSHFLETENTTWKRRFEVDSSLEFYLGFDHWSFT